LNKTTEAGLYWPGYFKVDTTTPGKEWVAEYKRNQKLKSMSSTHKRDVTAFQQGTRMGGNSAVTL
jgi:hypothetical protein